MPKPPQRHLRIVETPPLPVFHEAEAFVAKPGERSLFVSNDPNMLIFVDFTSVDEAELLSLLISSKPKHIIDLRLVPRFDIGNLNRKLVFSVFKNSGSSYHDLGALIGPAQMREVAGIADVLARLVQERIFSSERHPLGPIAVFIDSRNANAAFIDEFANAMDHANPLGWQTLRVPTINNSNVLAGRSMVFISHATPDDNPFAHWLSSQLTLSGYEVWTDFERLAGGEFFWDTIEDVIRNRAAKVVVAASRLAQTRAGVLDEIALAVSVERSLGLSNFVIPLRIDDIPFADFRANIARRNILNFEGNWAAGLALLLKALETDRVRREPNGSQAQIGKMIHDRLRTQKGLLDEPDPVLVNWIDVKKWPAAIHALSLPVASLRVGAKARISQIPHVQYNDVLLSFANAHRFSTGLGGMNVGSAGSVATGEFVKGRWNQFPGIKQHIAQKLLSNLVRQAWEQTARSKGLTPFSLASGANCWFLANKRVDGNKVQFSDITGKRRTKALVGFSQKRNVYWHFAAEVRPLANHPETLVIKPHVIFSEDGATPLESAARMHALRRGFCKSWWNDRWRDLTVAYLAFLADGNEEFALGAGGSEIIVSGRMSRLECPVSPDESDGSAISEDIALLEDEEDPEIDEDELNYSLQIAPDGDVK
ncbi:MAG: hypothetical protein C0429_11350 [Sphingopyxis sp.]|nr:hypothetical protein [Sphingopyxis sp.]